MKEHFSFVILGGGTVAGYAVKQLIKNGIKGEDICIISNESIYPMNRIGLSKDYLKDKVGVDKLLINPSSFYADHQIHTLLNTHVEVVRFPEKKLQFLDGTQLGYDQLLIATGSELIRLNAPGENLSNIFYLRTHQDADQIKHTITHAQKAVVIGGGYIGSEVAASLKQQGLDVTMVFLEEHLLEQIIGKETATFINTYYQEQGVKLKGNNKVASFQGQDQVESVQLENGENIPADLVVIGIGCRPATNIFKNTPLYLNNGIPVNEYGETNLKDVYAAGDLAFYPDAYYGKHRREEQWKNAFDQAKHVANVMTGHRMPYKHLPYLFSNLFDFNFEIFGDNAGADQTVLRGNMSSLNFEVYWLKGNRLIAALLTRNRPRANRKKVQEWIQQSTPLNPNSLSDENNDLENAE